jgi:hypothetical protein
MSKYSSLPFAAARGLLSAAKARVSILLLSGLVVLPAASSAAPLSPANSLRQLLAGAKTVTDSESFPQVRHARRGEMPVPTIPARHLPRRAERKSGR